MYLELRVFHGNAHPKLTEAICDALGEVAGKVRVGRFSDGEVQVEIDRAVGNADAESGADGARHQPHLAAMSTHQFGGDGETEPRTLRLGREERIEHAVGDLARDAGAVIRDHQFDLGRLPV